MKPGLRGASREERPAAPPRRRGDRPASAWPDRLWGAAQARLYPDKAAFDAEEDRRFALLEEHWDVIVNEVKGP